MRLRCVEKNLIDLVYLLCSRDEIDLHAKDKFNRTCFDIACRSNNVPILNYLNEIRERDLIKNQLEADSILEIKKSLKFTFEHPKSSNKQSNKTRKNSNFLNEEYESTDDELEIAKKTKISSSPIQNIEDTLIWLQNQALSSSNDYFSDKQEFSLTGNYAPTLIWDKFIFYLIYC